MTKPTAGPTEPPPPQRKQGRRGVSNLTSVVSVDKPTLKAPSRPSCRPPKQPWFACPAGAQVGAGAPAQRAAPTRLWGPHMGAPAGLT